jgi:hypothetical protein
VGVGPREGVGSGVGVIVGSGVGAIVGSGVGDMTGSEAGVIVGSDAKVIVGVEVEEGSSEDMDDISVSSMSSVDDTAAFADKSFLALFILYNDVAPSIIMNNKRITDENVNIISNFLFRIFNLLLS